MKASQRINYLKLPAQISLFGISYLPLFLILIARTIIKGRDFLYWGGFNSIAVSTFITHFGIALLLIMFIISATYGTIQTFNNINRYKESGFKTSIKSVNSKSAETINYLATYIIPFVYDVQSIFDAYIMAFIVVLIFIVYINSSLIAVNPILAMKFGIFEIEYQENDQIRNAIIISSNKYLLEGDNVKLYQIGHKLYYCFNS